LLAEFFSAFTRIERGEYKSQLQRDFLNFEGNAQTIRIVSKLQVLADYYGLNLTAGTLSAALKYTASSDQADTKSTIHEKRKPGFFASENDLITRVREITGTGESRNPITFLVEAADDIVYSVVDLEDGVKKGAIGWEEVESRLKQAASGDDGLLSGILDESYEYIKRAEPKLAAREHDEAMSQIFRTFAISRFSLAAIDSFKNNYSKIINGEFHGDLIKDSKVADIVKACKDTAKACIFRRDSTILEREIAGRHVIYDLMDKFWEAVKNYDPEAEPANDFPAKIRSLISPNYRRVFDYSVKNGSHPREYYRMQLVTDYVCGMTDSFATRLHAKLTNG